MHAFLIVGSKAAVNAKKEEKVKELETKAIEFPLTKISDVRELNNFTKLKLSEKTAIIIHDFNSASTEAQNAFLKSLEEPQENLYFILTSETVENILETIISRCEVIEVNEKIKLTDEENEKIEKFLKARVGERLKIMSEINKREEAVLFIKNLILVCHEEFIKKPEMALFLESANKTLKNLLANGNVTLQLISFLVNIQ